MTKILKFVYAIIILLSLFLVPSNADEGSKCNYFYDCITHCLIRHPKPIPICLNGECFCIH
uniref:Nodule-specific cysteine-rich peptide L07 n=1 Tax=Lens culinaris TaxID=3864 RepID=A0A7T8DV67_LENCU|nr:nodule-specific cysteine-rich peptide L07 [Lens culinaris]